MIVRICAEKNKKLDNVALVKGVIAIVFNEQKTFAYGYGLKNQGGNNFGDYHIIGFKDNGSFNFSVGNFQPFDGFYDEYRLTAEKITKILMKMRPANISKVSKKILLALLKTNM